MEIKALIISKIDEKREFLKEMLDQSEIQIIGESRGGVSALDKIENVNPNLVIMTYDKFDTDVINIAERIYSTKPNTVVVFIVDELSVANLQKSMEAGVRNVNIFPEDKTDFVSWLTTAYNTDKVHLMNNTDNKNIGLLSQIVTVFGAKGGIGKTTIAVNLAAKLASQNYKVALLDFDLQFGDVGVFLNLDVKDTLAELLQEKSKFDIDSVRSYMNIHSSGVHVLAAPKSPEYAESINANQIEKLLNVLRAYYDYVILDTPATFNDITMTAIEGSASVIFVTGLDISILRNSKISMNLLESLQQKDKVKVVINREVDGNITQKDVEKIIGKNVWATIPSDYSVAVNSLNKGIPFVVSSPKNKMSTAFNLITNKLTNGDEAVIEIPKKHSLFGSLGKKDNKLNKKDGDK